jgi:hypothetical protein
MSKTPFRMPQRTEHAAAEIDQWVAGGEGAVAPETTPRPERPTGKLARLTIDLPPELHAKFKAACALRGTRMIDEVRKFIQTWTQKDI